MNLVFQSLPAAIVDEPQMQIAAFDRRVEVSVDPLIAKPADIAGLHVGFRRVPNALATLIKQPGVEIDLRRRVDITIALQLNFVDRSENNLLPGREERAKSSKAGLFDEVALSLGQVDRLQFGGRHIFRPVLSPPARPMPARIRVALDDW